MSEACDKKSCPSSKGKGGTCGSPDAKIAMQNMIIKSSLDKIKNKILVMSGKGGVGKSTVSTNLALGLANRGYKVGLIDVDLHGPDICRMLNLTQSLSDVEVKGGLIPPMKYNDNLSVISLEYMMADRDDPIIWRGPLKIQAIRQFISDIDWGELDYLVVDAPPGTGDEPLTVSSTIKDAYALIVTTPQEVALADVRKSINFCKHVKMQIVGLVENMSGFVCPHCRETVEIFKSGGGERTAREFSIPFLGKIPMDPLVVIGGDDGKPYLSSQAESPAIKAFSHLVEKVVESMPVKIDKAVGCNCGDICRC
ncbi:MAG: Mrp/NBP35 family ATP-binding protein [Proteobacteria bacterium]|nr:Mrp/NBP35 family ATP-binding protein [Pseudomonadota bacterium]MBU1708464.1 Mrp/NBP35 family ATP-binding protein [Pseudomonadota bacterium]